MTRRQPVARATLDDVPVDVCSLIVANLPIQAIYVVARSCKLLCHAVRALARPPQSSNFSLLPPVDVRKHVLLDREYVIARSLQGVVIGGGKATIVGAKGKCLRRAIGGLVRTGKGLTHVTGVHFIDHLEVRGEVTLIGCRLAAGATIAAGGVLRLQSSTVHCCYGSPCKIGAGATLIAFDSKFCAPERHDNEAPVGFHVLAQSPTAIELRECIFDGTCSSDVFSVSTPSSTPMQRLVVCTCTFRGDTQTHAGGGGLLIRLNGPLPYHFDVSCNRWYARTLAIIATSTATPPLAAAAVPDFIPAFQGMITVRCVANEFLGGAALFAAGAKVCI